MENKILELEMKLLDKNVRASSEDLEKLLSKEFVEIGASGRIYHYEDVLNLHESEEIDYEINNFRIQNIAEDSILALYTIEITDELNIKHKSNRSSIWIKRSNQWRIIFHQGTNIAE